MGEPAVIPKPPRGGRTNGGRDPAEVGERRSTGADRAAKRKLRLRVGAGVVVAAGLGWWLHARQFESTDDAQIDRNISVQAHKANLELAQAQRHQAQLNLGSPRSSRPPTGSSARRLRGRYGLPLQPAAA